MNVVVMMPKVYAPKRSIYKLVLRYGDWVEKERPAWAFDENGKPRGYDRNLYHHGVVEERLA